MDIVGGVIEKKKIGLPLGSSGGTFYNTYYDNTDNSIKLNVAKLDGSGNSVYEEEGYWISDKINLQDKFKDYEKIFTTHVDSGSSHIAIQTRTSSDGINWDDWTPIAMDGTIQSETKQYIQVKIIFYAGFVTDVYLISDFNDEDAKNLFEDNTFIDTANGLRLKREYEFDMELDESWNDEGSLHRKLINKDEWLRIDGLNIVNKVVK